MKNWRSRLKPWLISLDLNQSEHHWKTNTLIHLKRTYKIWYVTSNLRDLVQNSKVIRHKTSNVIMKTRYYLFLLTKRTTYLSFLRTIITNYWKTTSQNHTKKQILLLQLILRKKPNALLNASILMTQLNNLTNVNPSLHLKIKRKIFKLVWNSDYCTLQNLDLASLVNTILKK